ncbi:hypothetical protein [Neorhizobium galegae]|uniref:hypothetical protein n=1 Tax=Neorhizobium galegae TaxID=399 RepID=UPI001F247F84|nr:hypothetical protein [Neorhizobium galegae]UIK05389.1 hypothetical protein LZK81_22590 [Neorhizobium galegae]
MRVSRPVHLPVNVGVSPESPNQASRSTRKKMGQGKGPGSYLAKSGSVYIFQIKMPKASGGTRDIPPLRLSLGACSHRRARLLADLLAAKARLMFDSMRFGRGMQEDDPADSEMQALEKIIEMKGELKAYLRMIEGPEAPIAAEELQKTAGIRDLVNLSRELEKQARGEPFNELIIGHAEMLKQSAIAKLSNSSALMDPKPNVAVNLTPAPLVKTSQPDVHQALVAEPPAWSGPDRPRDAEGKLIPAFELDRRSVKRPQSSQLRLSDVIPTYLATRRLSGGANIERDLATAESRLALFVELIGDHCVDTYVAADLQAFINHMQYWPGDNNQRDPNLSPWQVIEDNKDLHLKPLAEKTLKEGYLAVVKAAVRSSITGGGFTDPFAGARLTFPKTAASPRKATPIGTSKMNALFREGVESGLMEDIMLPLLGHLTSRRLGLLIHLRGTHIREQFPDVWVGQVTRLSNVNGSWTTVPVKTQDSERYFVLHGFLNEIGFIDWATRQGSNFLFPNIMKLVDPSKSGSSYMQRLFKRAGIKGKSGEESFGRREVFHSLRSGNIQDMRDSGVDPRDRRVQAGHSTGSDEHDLYGFDVATEKEARKLKILPLDPEIDYSIFRGLDFDEIAKNGRVAGPPKRK